jgi:hypothetical protein
MEAANKVLYWPKLFEGTVMFSCKLSHVNYGMGMYNSFRGNGYGAGWSGNIYEGSGNGQGRNNHDQIQ